MRIIPDLSGILTNALQNWGKQESNYLEQLSSGQRVNRLSDSPSDAASLVLNHASSAQDDQFLRNIVDVRGMASTADAALNNVVQTLNQVIALGTQGATGTLSDANRQALAQQVSGLQQQLVSLANTTYAGRYLFAGNKITTVPFAADVSQPSGVRYDGDSGTGRIELTPGNFVATNVPGDTLFMNGTYGVFAAVKQLADALTSGTGIDTATASVQQAFQNATSQRVQYGMLLAQLNNAESALSGDKFQLSSQADAIGASDLGKVATSISQLDVYRNALLAAGARVSQNSLLDFLK